MRPRTKLLSTVLSLGFLLLGTQAFADETRVDRVSSKDFAATVKAAETAIKSQGFMVLVTIDHRNMLRMVGTDLKGGATTVEFGKPEMGKMLLPMAPQAGLEFPGRFYIWQRADGKTVVSYRKPSADLGRYDDEKLKAMGRDMDGMWAKFAADATK